MSVGRALLVLVVAALASGCGPASTPRDGSEAAPRPEQPLFEFHSGFWLNLHLRLHYAATGRHEPPPAAVKGPAGPVWTATVDFYKHRFRESGGMGLIFDDQVISLDRRLSELGSGPSLLGVEPALAAQLEAAAAVARGDWPEQDRANRAWIAALAPALQRHGKALQVALSAAFQAPWPRGPIRVDVCGFAGRLGAFTVLNPTHITISSSNPAYAGDAALEMIFHEASHALIEPIEKKLDTTAARRGRKAPENLWHALLFYTTGEIVKLRLGPEYVPYATKNGLWARGWSDFETTLRRNWQPYLDGNVDLDHALGAIIDDLPEASLPPSEAGPKAIHPSRAKRPRPEGMVARP